MPPAKKTRILLADDHTVVRRGFGLILSKSRTSRLSARRATAERRSTWPNGCRPDVAVIDVSMPELNGIEATRRICTVSERTRVLALSMHRDAVYVRETLRAGARGYLVKDADDDAFLVAVRAVARGDGYVSPSVADAVLSDYRKHVTNPADLLTSREREILQMIAEGKTNKEIANTLY